MADLLETTFFWTVKNFDMCCHSPGECLVSPEFSVDAYKCCLQLYPRGKGNKDDEYISVILKNLGDCDNAFITCEICIVDDTGICKLSHTTKTLLLKNGKRGPTKFIKRNQLLSAERRNLLPHNNLTIRCRASICVEEVGGELYNETEAEILSRDFGELLKNGLNPDLKIIIGDSKFNVHRAVLDYRCPQLTTRLTDTGVLNEYSLPDIEAETLRALLQYLYTGTFSICNMYQEIECALRTLGLPGLRKTSVFPDIKRISAITEVNISPISFEWIVTNFSTLKLNQEIVYPAFCYSVHDWGKMKVILTHKKLENGSNRLELQFRKMRPDVTTFIRCRIFFYGKGLKPITVKEYEHIFQTENWITPLSMQTELSQVLFNDTLHMFFRLSVSHHGTNSKIEEVLVYTKTQDACDEVISDLKLLQWDFRRLCEFRQFSDIVLRAGDEEIPAHKAILCARSQVFSKMFEHDTVEKKKGVVTIEDVDPTTISSMLRYIYCGHVDLRNVAEVINMYAAADKYELLNLKQKCAVFLKDSLFEDHVGEFLLLADAHHDDSLKKCVFDYITSNPKRVLSSEKSLSVLKNRLDVYPDIFNVLLEQYSLLKEENSCAFKE